MNIATDHRFFGVSQPLSSSENQVFQQFLALGENLTERRELLDLVAIVGAEYCSYFTPTPPLYFFNNWYSYFSGSIKIRLFNMGEIWVRNN